MAIINGTPGADNLIGTTDGDVISGLGGDDTIDALTRPTFSGAPGDFVDGGTGIDTLVVNASGETQSVQLSTIGASRYEVRSATGNFHVDAENMERVSFTGGSGNDTIHTGQRGGTVNGGAGVDWWLADVSHLFTNVTFRLGTSTAINAAGLTSITNVERLNLATGTGNDKVDGGAEGDSISTGEGDDTINAKSRQTFSGAPGDLVNGGDDIDTLVVNAASDTQGVQLHSVGASRFELRSTSGNFHVDANNMEVIDFTGSTGADTINTGQHGGSVNGRAGTDWWLTDLSALTTDVDFTLGVTTSIAAADLTSILSIERLTMTTGNGNDTIVGGEQGDAIVTGNGNDTIDVKTRPTSSGSPGDFVDGGNGLDTLIVDASGESQAVQLFSVGDSRFEVRSTSGNFHVDANNMEVVNFTGGTGADTINTGERTGTVNGGNGIDWWLADLSRVADVINFVLGTTTAITPAGMTALAGLERIALTTGAGDDAIVGGAQGDSIATGNGNDTIDAKTRPTTSGSPGDAVNGGNGIDTLIVNASAESQAVQLHSVGSSRFEVRSNTGNFHIDADNMEVVRFTGGAGGDTINTGSHGGTVDAGGGVDWWLADLSALATGVEYSVSATTAIAAAGLTSITSVARINLTTGSGDDTITGASQGDTIVTGAGNDTINTRTRPTASGSAGDFVDGGAGIDTLVVVASAETQGVQLFTIGASRFEVRSDTGNFHIDANNTESIKFTGGAGADVINTGDAAGTVNGGDGIDWWLANLSALSSAVIFTLGTTTSIGAAGLTSISNLERINLTTGSGNDTIAGGAQGDVIFTGNGNDTIDAKTRPMASGSPGDVVNGGNGIDTLIVDASAETQAVQLFTIGTSRFEVRSTTGNFHVDADNMEIANFTGGSGNDFAAGHARADTLAGGAGNDTLAGGDGNDSMRGSAGNDVLTGGRGADQLSGGGSGDVFDYNLVTDSGVASGKLDSVSDFVSLADVFDLSGIDANHYSADSDQAFVFIGGAGFSGARGELRSIAGQIEADVNGDAVADFRVFLTNGATAVAGDFIL